MQIDFAFILAAGKGTRMGEIGKHLPKPLWPIFDKSLLELQIAWCISLGIKKIYVNTHFLENQIQREVERILKNYQVEIVILHEDPLLDSGGCIHNLGARKEVQYRGRFLLINSDQFYFFPKSFLVEAQHTLDEKDTPAVLFGLKVTNKDNYNETVLDKNGKLISIEKNAQSENYFTYSGLGLINLEKLKSTNGISKFFETVANYKEQAVYFVVPDVAEYWDFGTSALYVNNIKKILGNFKNQSKSILIKFLIDNGAIDAQKIISTGYERFLMNDGIDLERTGHCERGKISYQQLKQEF